jgi:hypothetical protein
LLKKLNAKLRNIWRDYGSLITFAGIFFGGLSYLLSNYVDLRSIFDPGIKVEGVQEVVEAIGISNDTLEEMLPSDAIEQLVRRGYTFDRWEFFRAGQNGDVESVKLFCAAGGEGFIDPRSFSGIQVFNDRVREVVQECQKIYRTVACDVIAEPALREESVNFLRMYASYDTYYGLATLCMRDFQGTVEKLIAEKTDELNSELQPICESTLQKIQARVSENEGKLIALHEIGAQADVRLLWQMLAVNISMEFDESSYECRSIGVDFNDPLKRLAMKVSLQDEIANWP